MDSRAPSVTIPTAIEPAPVTARVKLTYGMGQLVESSSTTVYSTFLFFFYTALLGLPGSLVGLATAISLVIDAVADPLLGSWSDATRSRWGRRIPFMALGAPGVALGLGLVFSPPAGASTPVLFAWLLAISLLMRFAVSVFNVPFIALGAEISEDYAERSSVVAYRTIFSIAGPLIALVLGYGVFLAGKNGLTHAGGYAPLAWSIAALILIGGVVSVLGSHRFAATLPTEAPEAVAIHRRFVGEIVEIFKNPSFRVLFAVSVLFWVAQGVASALAQHLNLYVWRISSSQILLVTLAYFAGLVFGLPLTPILAKRVEKRNLVMAGLVILCVAQGGLAGLRGLGIFMLSGSVVVWPLALNSFVAGVGVTFAGISIASMMADAADEHDFLFRRRREGLYFAGLGFAGKAATGVGALVAGVGLDAIGFPAGVAQKGAEIHLSAGTLDGVALIAGPLVAAVAGLATILLIFYRIDRRRHDLILAELRRRRVEG